jgi:xylulokinase
MRPAFLGIDLGTSQVKALLVGPDARVLGRASAPYEVTVPCPGQAETDPGEWWRATGTAVREASAAASAGGGAGAGGADVAGLAVSGQMHGVVLADAAGVPLRPAIVWLDRRAAAEAARYGELPAGLTAPLGNDPSPGMAGPILRWLATHEPATVTAARWALQPKDWLRLRLTGEAATEPTDASGTLLFDLARGAWATDLIDALGLPAALLPAIREPAEVAGRLRPEAAAHLGLRPGIPVATGAADTAAALFAARPPAGAALLTLGTGGQWIVPVGPGVPGGWRPAARTNLFRAVVGGDPGGEAGLYRLAAVQNMGETINWVRTNLAVSWEQAYSTAARPWRADTPVFLPYLAHERWEPGLTGGWAGLTLAHTRDDLLRAALEGVAFLLRDRLGDLRAAGHDPARVLLGGGGVRHPAWRQLLADVLGLPLYPAASPAASPAAASPAGSPAGASPPAGRPGAGWGDTGWLSPAGAAMLALAAGGREVPGGVGRDRSDDKEAEPVVPGQREAASTSYGRYLSLKRGQGR